MGSDRPVEIKSSSTAISIHAPRMGSDTINSLRQAFQVQFQSTLPAWGATYLPDLLKVQVKFQSTLPAWGATRPEYAHSSKILISIHAPRMGSDGRSFFSPYSPQAFQSTLPAWGATRLQRPEYLGGSISIHAPRMGSDCSLASLILIDSYFNPRSPHGERP